MASNDPSVRSTAASIAANRRWARTSEAERTAATQKAREGLYRRWEREVDPDGTLAPAERAKRVENLRQAHYASMRLARSRKRVEREKAIARHPAGKARKADLVTEQVPGQLSIEDALDGGAA